MLVTTSEETGHDRVAADQPNRGRSTRKTLQEAILAILEARFGTVPEDIVEWVRELRSQKKLKALVKQAALCRDLDAFRKHL
jgi:hypothetical protein